MTFIASPYSRRAAPGFQAPVAKMTWVKPWSNRLWADDTSTPVSNWAPMALAQGDVAVDGLVPDAEGGDHVADDAAQGRPCAQRR